MRESLEFDPASNEIGFINLSIFYLFTFKFYISIIKYNNLSVQLNNFIRTKIFFMHILNEQIQ